MTKKTILSLALLTFTSLSLKAAEENRPFTLPPLPYKENALEPYISARTLSFHYGKHHQAYVDNLNKLVKENELTPGSLEDVIQISAQDPKLKTVFNNAAQNWNHTFYWSSLKPQGGGKPTGPIAGWIDKSFGNYDNFRTQFRDAGTKLFGSGWVWLVQEPDNSLKILSTPDADLPFIHGERALLVCDVWEHAYYLDYQNRRKDYVDVFLDYLVNWDFANQNLKK